MYKDTQLLGEYGAVTVIECLLSEAINTTMHGHENGTLCMLMRGFSHLFPHSFRMRGERAITRTSPIFIATPLFCVAAHARTLLYLREYNCKATGELETFQAIPVLQVSTKCHYIINKPHAHSQLGNPQHTPHLACGRIRTVNSLYRQLKQPKDFE